MNSSGVVLPEEQLFQPLMEDQEAINSTFECHGATDEQLRWFDTFSYWTEGVMQLGLGTLGFFANCLVIPVLRSKKMNNIFNHNLVYLAIFDNVYIICSILECIRKYFFTTHLQTRMFVYGLYQLQNIAFICSVYQTIVLAFQRYLAISRPIEYFLANNVAALGNGPSNSKSIMKYMVPVVLFGILFNLPKFFEITIEEVEVYDQVTNMTGIELELKPSELRLNDNYVLYYVNVARFVVSGLFPLLSLTFLHLAIYRAIQARREAIQSTLMNDSGLSNCSTVEELVLFVIVWIFFICTLPRIILNVYEMVSLEEIRRNFRNQCFRFPLWVLMTTNATYILTTLNCCINFVVYFVMYEAFRQRLIELCSITKSRIKNRWLDAKESCLKIRKSSNDSKQEIELRSIQAN